MLLTNRKVFCLQLPAFWSIIRRASSTNHRRTSWFAISPALWNVYWLSFAVSSYTVSLFRSENEMTKMFTVPTQLQWLREKKPDIESGPSNRSDMLVGPVYKTHPTQPWFYWPNPSQPNPSSYSYIYFNHVTQKGIKKSRYCRTINPTQDHV